MYIKRDNLEIGLTVDDMKHLKIKTPEQCRSFFDIATSTVPEKKPIGFDTTPTTKRKKL